MQLYQADVAVLLLLGDNWMYLLTVCSLATISFCCMNEEQIGSLDGWPSLQFEQQATLPHLVEQVVWLQFTHFLVFWQFTAICPNA